MKKIISLLILFLSPLVVKGQSMTYSQFMSTVAEKNAAYLAEKYNVDIATANVQAAKVFNDPELSVDYGYNQDRVLQMGQSVEMALSYDLDLAGERRARLEAAKSESEVTKASVNAYLSELKLEASQAWAEAWRLRKSCEVLEDAVTDMMQIAKSDSVRLALGDVGRIDATQSRLEALALRGELLSMKSEYKNALMNLSYLCGGEAVDGIAEDVLHRQPLGYSEGELEDLALANRADLRAAEMSQTLSENNLRIVKASRAFNMGVNVGYSYNTEVRNEIAPAPKFNGLTVGISIPLKFSSMNRGEMNAARAQVLQSQKYYESAKTQVCTEASQAYNSYLAAKEVYNQYDGTLLEDAKSIMSSRKLGYMKGDSSLIELLTAQQTYRDVMQNYIDACCNLFVSQAELERAIGL